ncbi:methionine aminopeptidase 2 [Anaeramoeba flamelloides]|uniref:Methionine aminopeptidase 2 n=1 Tax=Anaeramoeba flamelloides TaxID=1746091 RepID=A0ABQ8YLR7_9EUKA|nr:methionine aminopeptidase 2 [Anaeramoeba flamelloides]
MNQKQQNSTPKKSQQNNSISQTLSENENSNETQKEQTLKPKETINTLFPEENFPEGKTIQYVLTKTEEKRSSNDIDLEQKETQFFEEKLKNLRKAAEVHRQVRKFANTLIKPGSKLLDICDQVEDYARFFIEEDGLKAGLAFPFGCSINNIAAHYTSNPGDETILEESDVLKIDFGTHVNGYIIDSAYTIAFNPKYDTLLNASKEATYSAIKLSGIDSRLLEIGDEIEEIITSYEIELDNKVYPLTPIFNLCGHSLDQYLIHSGTSILPCNYGPNLKMEEGKMYAIETFASTGKGFAKKKGECSHYMLKPNAKKFLVTRKSSKAFLQFLENEFGTLAFCNRWLKRLGRNETKKDLKRLSRSGVLGKFPPLGDIKGSYVSQHEHTIILRPKCTEILSWGEDY